MLPETPEKIRSQQLEIDINLAVSHRLPVLITASGDHATTIVRAIAAGNQQRLASEVLTCDSTCDDVTAAITESARHVGADRDTIIWLREVHALNPSQQQTVAMNLIADRPGHADRMPRIIASSTIDLFDRVRAGAFDARLFYLLNTIHIVVPPARSLETRSLERSLEF